MRLLRPPLHALSFRRSTGGEVTRFFRRLPLFVTHPAADHPPRTMTHALRCRPAPAAAVGTRAAAAASAATATSAATTTTGVACRRRRRR